MSILTPRALNRAFLARQMLLQREKLPATKAIERLVGLQAQVARPPFVGLWTRLEHFQRKELSDAFHKRRVVRVTAMRGTLHAMTSADYIALRGALQPMLTRGMASILRGRGADIDIDAIQEEGRAFFAKQQTTFDALRAHLKRKFPNADERALAYAIRTHVPLVQVPTTESQWAFPAAADFALADTWLSKNVSTAATPAKAVVLRYLAAFGPATPADAQAWSGMNGLREMFEELRPKLVTFQDARKRELFDLPNAPRPDEDVTAPIRFIPDYDNLVLSHDDRSRIMADAHRSRVTLKNLMVRATFLVDGVVAGTWKTERKRKAAVLVLEPFGTIAKRTRSEIEAEGEHLLSFLEEDATEREIRWDGEA
jgi:hypothetical protein